MLPTNLVSAGELLINIKINLISSQLNFFGMLIDFD